MTTGDGKVYDGTWINGKFNDIDFKDENESVPDFTEEFSDSEKL